MTSPPGNGTPIVPGKGYTAQTIYQLQNVDPDALGQQENLDLWEILESFRDSVHTALLGGFTNVAQAIMDKVVDVIAAITKVANGDFDDLSDFFDGWGARLEQIEASIADLESTPPTFPVTPSYVSDIQDMASCSRNACKTLSISNNLSTSTASTHTHSVPSGGGTSGASGAHSHTVSGSISASWVPATYSPVRYANIIGVSQSPVDYTPVIVDRYGRVKKLRWKTGDDNSLFGIDAYYIALCIYNPTNKNIEKVWDSGNIKDTVANVSGQSREVAIDMHINQTCTPGQLLFVAHQQIAPGLAQATRSFGCEPLSGDARPADLAPLDGAFLRTPGRYGSVPSSISAASLTRMNGWQPWVSVSVDTTTMETP